MYSHNLYHTIFYPKWKVFRGIKANLILAYNELFSYEKNLLLGASYPTTTASLSPKSPQNFSMQNKKTSGAYKTSFSYTPKVQFLYPANFQVNFTGFCSRSGLFLAPTLLFFSIEKSLSARSSALPPELSSALSLHSHLHATFRANGQYMAGSLT